jgi:hypothetical protein
MRTDWSGIGLRLLGLVLLFGVLCLCYKCRYDSCREAGFTHDQCVYDMIWNAE